MLLFAIDRSSIPPPFNFLKFKSIFIAPGQVLFFHDWQLRPPTFGLQFFYIICTKIMRQLCIQREIFMINYSMLYYFTAWWWIHLSSFRLEDGILSEILFSFCLLVTKCGVFLKITNFSVDQSGAFVMGGVAYGIRANFKQALSLILISLGK